MWPKESAYSPIVSFLRRTAAVSAERIKGCKSGFFGFGRASSALWPRGTAVDAAVDGSVAGTDLVLNPGDGVLYAGAEIVHERPVLAGNTCLQLIVGWRQVDEKACNSQ